MADLEIIKYTPMREIIAEGVVYWIHEKLGHTIEKLPQIFWRGGEPWSEANHWALTRATSTVGGHIKTVTSLMKHLAAYASWLESVALDWRHFPMRRQERALVLYRGELIAQRDQGSLAPSTASARMAAVIQFYRHARVFGFLARKSPMWQDRQVVVRYFDRGGFERTLSRLSSELAIPNRARPGLCLEDGLTPLRNEDAVRLLAFTKEQSMNELNLMLSLGVLSGARIGTITTLGVKDIENAYRDIHTPEIYRMRVGPGTRIKTKGSVSGELLLPRFLIDDLKAYAYSVHRLRRQALASKENQGLLFLTIRGNPYEPGSFNRLMTNLRRRALNAGMRFMERFKFHQTRATFGTWLMAVAMEKTDTKAAVAFVRDAMLHKDEKTTFLYVRFIQEAHVKSEVANEFSTLFAGVLNRNWKHYCA